MGNLDRKFKGKGNNAPNKSGIPIDPIVRTSDDVNAYAEDMQTTKVRRIKGTPLPVTGSSLFSDTPIKAGQPEQTIPAATELIFATLRFKWTILTVFILVTAPLIAAIWTQVIPEYRARGEVQIRPIIRPLVFKTNDTGPIPYYEGFVNTQVAIMRSPAVLNRVLEQPDVQRTKWYSEPKKTLVQRLTGQTVTPIERLKNSLTAQPRRRSEIMDVSFSSANAKDAETIVNAVLDHYMKYIGETTNEQKDLEDGQRDQLYEKLRNEIAGLELDIKALSKNLGTAMPQERISAMLVRLDETQASIDELTQTIAMLESQINRVDSNDVMVTETQEQPPYDQDTDWHRLNENVRTIRHYIATSVLKPKHPSMIKLTKDLDFAEESLRLREAQLDEQWRSQQETGSNLITGDSGPAGTLKSMEQQLLLAKQRRQFLVEKYKKDKTEYDKFFNINQEFNSYSATLKEKRQLFDEIRQVKEQKDVERGVAGSIKVLTRAFAPSKPSEDRRVVFSAMVMFMGLGLGGGAAFLRASRSQTIYALKDMPPTLHAPFLGYIPLTRIKKTLGKSLHKEIQKMREDKIESVRLVRTALLSRLNKQNGAAVLIASAAEGTGKSTFTMMLGKSLAQSGKRVIMIDADLRRMTLSKRFGLLDEPGFMESLRSKSVNLQHIFSTETSGLSILPAGMPNDDGSTFEGTANGAFKACISQLRRHFDIVLLDSSPILPVADATILSSQVDGTIMVERELVSRRSNVIDALARLDSAGGRLMGTVFVGSRENGNYGYGYGYNYSKKQYS